MKEYWRRVIVAAVLLFFMAFWQAMRGSRISSFFTVARAFREIIINFFLVPSFDSCVIMSGTHDGPTRKGKNGMGTCHIYLRNGLTE